MLKRPQFFKVTFIFSQISQKIYVKMQLHITISISDAHFCRHWAKKLSTQLRIKNWQYSLRIIVQIFDVISPAVATLDAQVNLAII